MTGRRRVFTERPHAGPLPPCTTCGGPTRLVSGACGTWLLCTTGPLDYPSLKNGRASSHDTHVDTRDAKRSRVALICATTGFNCDDRGEPTPEVLTDERDTRATFRDLVRHWRDEAYRAHGLTPTSERTT